MVDLSGKRVAILVDDYFDEAEFMGPLQALKGVGATVDIVATKGGKVRATNHDVEPADIFQADVIIDDVRIDEYDALVLPGGTVNADHLRTNEKARIWIRKFMDMGKPIAAICHAPWALASAGVADGRRLTSFPSLQDDLRNAGADWVDEAVVIDNNLITSRKPDDILAFDDALISMLAAAKLTA